MKLFALLTDGFGARGGIAQYNCDLLQALSLSPDLEKILVLSRQGPKVQSDKPPMMEVIEPKGSRWLYAITALGRSGQFGKNDWIFCGHIYMLPLAVALSFVTGSRVWLQIHGIEAWNRGNLAVNIAMKYVARVTAVSRYTRRRFLEWSSIRPEMVKVIPNTVDKRFLPGEPSDRRRFAEDDQKLLLSVSRLSSTERYKGQDRMIETLAALEQEHCRFVYMIAGEGDDISRLQELVASHHLEKCIRFIGYVPDEDLPALFRTADIFAMPSTGEGFGIVFLQALACGCAVIAGNADGSTDPLLDGRAGLLVAPEDKVELRNALKSAMNNPIDGTFAARIFSRQHFEAAALALISQFNGRDMSGMADHD